MEFEIVYYEDNSGKKPVEEFLIDLEIRNIKLQAKAVDGIRKLRNKLYHTIPLSRYLEQGLWEMRVKSGSDILRIIYTFKKGRIIILLHIFVKKKQKIPKHELEIARKRLKEIKLKEAN